MTDSATPEFGELIPRGLAERHEALRRQYWGGLIEQCEAIAAILNEETYRAEGYQNFSEFCDGSGIAKSRGYELAAAATVLRVSLT